jgi:hypothetical protein
MEREDPGDFHPVINEWERAWAVSSPGEGGPWATAWFSTLNVETRRDYLAPLTFEQGGGAGQTPAYTC